MSPASRAGNVGRKRHLVATLTCCFGFFWLRPQWKITYPAFRLLSLHMGGGSGSGGPAGPSMVTSCRAEADKQQSRGEVLVKFRAFTLEDSLRPLSVTAATAQVRSSGRGAAEEEQRRNRGGTEQKQVRSSRSSRGGTEEEQARRCDGGVCSCGCPDCSGNSSCLPVRLRLFRASLTALLIMAASERLV